MLNIIHIDNPYLPKLLTPYGNGLWVLDLTGVEEYECADVIGKYTDILQIKPTKIGHIRIGLMYYDLVSSIEECWANPKTFYYDNSTYRIYINICDESTGLIGYQVPWGQRLEIGITSYYIDRVDYSRDDQAYYSDNYHRPIVSNIGDRTEKRDRVYYDNVSYTTTEIEMLNYDGHFNGQSLSNKVARHYILRDGKDFDQAVLMAYGIISKPDITNTKVKFTIDDLRKSLDVNISVVGKINTTNYPYLKAPDDDDEPEEKVFPVGIGQIKGYQPTCLDKGNTSSTTAAYALCATYGGYNLKCVDNVWVQLTDDNSQVYDLIIPAAGQTISDPKPYSKDSTYATVCTSSYNIDLKTGILYIPRDAVCTASINDDDISYSWSDLNVDYYGWYNKTAGEQVNICGVDLIKIGLNIFGGIDFENWNFDLTNFAIERIKSTAMAKAGWEVSRLIDEDLSITDFLKEVCQAMHLIYKLRGDNRYIVKVYESESTGDIKYRIEPEQLIDRTDNASQDTSQVISTCKIGYGYAGNDDNKKTLTDDSMEIEIQQTMHLTKSEEFETILATKQAAQLKSKALLTASLSPPTGTTFKLWMDKINAQLSVSDTIASPKDRNNNTAIYNITQIAKSYKNNTVTITANRISDVLYTGYIQGICYQGSCYRSRPYAITTYIED